MGINQADLRQTNVPTG